MSRRVNFYSDGIKLVGDLHVPPDLKPGEKRSGIVLCQGFATATIDKWYSALPELAEHFTQQGYVVLKFDYRGFGESEGNHWRLFPLEQVADIRNALTFLQVQEEVDQDSVGLFGTSFGGSNAPYAAAVDKRVRCVVANVPVGCGEKWLRSLREGWQWQDFLKELEEDWRTRVVTGESRRVPRLHVQYTSKSEVIALNKKLEDEEGFCRNLPLETAQAVIDYHPEDVVHMISPRPFLVISVADDELTPDDAARELYENAKDPKRWVSIHGLQTHYQVYEPPFLQIVMEEASNWFQQYMPARPKPRQKDVVESKA